MAKKDVAKLVEQLGAADQVKAYQANSALDTLVWQSGTSERSALAEALAAELAATKETGKNRDDKPILAPKHPAEVRRQICQHLAAVAGDAQVAVLRQALDDLDVREMARWALDRMTCSAATQALITAAVEAVGVEFRIGVIGALARRSGPAVVAALKQCAQESDPRIALSACEALCSHADPAIDPVLTAAGRRLDRSRTRVQRARIRLAETLAKANRPDAAERVYHDVLRDKPEKPQAQAAERGLGQRGRRAANS
jgi:hypothetical protein